MNENHPLIYDKQYKVWREGKCLGIATYIEDENIGDAFIIKSVSENGLVNLVCIPDKWILTN